MSWNWYGVKSVYRIEAKGVATSVDSLYDPDATLVEERIVLIRARSFDEAISKADVEAKSYQSSSHRNFYGQTVKTRYLKVCDAFELFDDPSTGTEVFSSTEMISKNVTDKEIITQHFGVDESISTRKLRRKFLNAHLPLIADKKKTGKV